MQNKGKQKIIMAACILAGICLAGIALIVGAVFQQKNPLAAGLAELAGEVAAKEAELGEYFWTDVIDQIGAGNVQAEYSFNIGNIPALQNITVGLDGEAKRDMEEKVFQTDLQVSVTQGLPRLLCTETAIRFLYRYLPSGRGALFLIRRM